MIVSNIYTSTRSLPIAFDHLYASYFLNLCWQYACFRLWFFIYHYIYMYIFSIYPFWHFVLMLSRFYPFYRLTTLLWRALVEKEKLASQLEFIPHWPLMLRHTCMFSIMELETLGSQDWVLGAWRKLKSIETTSRRLGSLEN